MHGRGKWNWYYSGCILGAALKNITRADLDATFSLKELPFEGGLTVKDTRHLILSDDPGLGIKGLKKEMLS